MHHSVQGLRFYSKCNWWPKGCSQNLRLCSSSTHFRRILHRHYPKRYHMQIRTPETPVRTSINVDSKRRPHAVDCCRRCCTRLHTPIRATRHGWQSVSYCQEQAAHFFPEKTEKAHAPAASTSPGTPNTALRVRDNKSVQNEIYDRCMPRNHKN